MLKKILNPFNIQLTKTSPSFVYLGVATSVVLHLWFYFAIFHFIRKVW